MNKQQLYTFGGALLASTSLVSTANAITIGRFTTGTLAFSTSALSISNLLFSTTTSTANAVTITPGATRFGATFGNHYTPQTAAGTAFSMEFIPTGGEFTSGTATLPNTFLLGSIGTAGGTAVNTMSASVACTGSTGFGTSFVINGCTALAASNGNGGSMGGNVTSNFVGVLFSGVTFTNASGLATVGNSVSLAGRVYNTATQGQFEAQATGNIITARAPLTVTLTAGANVTASATTTPTAFVSLSTTNGGNAGSTFDLVTMSVTGTAALQADLTTASTYANSTSSSRITVTSAALSSGALSRVMLETAGTDISITTVAVFSGGSVTFELLDGDFAAADGSVQIRAVFNGSTVIPAAAAGTASVTLGVDTTSTGQGAGTFTSGTAAVNQGGFRAEVNTFNASTNGPFSSYLRIHNNGANAGSVNISIRSDDHTSGAVLGSSFTTGTIASGSTMQLSAAEMEGTTTSTKLPSGGANIPTASRVGSYTISISGALVGYVQHILFDGEVVADLSSFRNGANTSSAP